MSVTSLIKRENSAMERAQYMQDAGKTIQAFLKTNFKTFGAVQAIMQENYPELTREEIYNFWSYKTMNRDMIHKMEVVLQKLKSE